MATKLLLTQDVDALGRKGEIVTVKPGYARNFLLPRGLGWIPDKNAIRKQERLREERREQAVVDKKDSEAIAEKLKEITLECTVKVDNIGHMFGSVSVQDLHNKLEQEHGIVLGKRDIQLKHPIKKLGSYEISVKLKEDVDAAFKVKVVGEGYVEPEPVPEPIAEVEQQPEEAPAEEQTSEEA